MVLDILSLIYKDNFPEKALEHFFSPVLRMEESCAETLIYPDRAYVEIFVFSLKCVQRLDE